MQTTLLRPRNCHLWNEMLVKPIEVVNQDKARARDAAARAGKNVDYYTIVFGDPHLPDAFVEVVWENDFLAIWFVDDDGGRRLVEFGFGKVSDQQMFLTDFGRWQYPAGARADYRDAELVESISYKQDGIVKHRINDVRQGGRPAPTTRKSTSPTTGSTSPTFDDLNYEWIRDANPPKGPRPPA